MTTDEEKNKYDLKASPYLWLFLDLFLCRIKEGSIYDFKKELTPSIAKSTHYKFLNSMVHYGVLRVSGKKPWGLNGILIYKIDHGRLYNVFIETPFGVKLRKVFAENTVMFDSFI